MGRIDDIAALLLGGEKNNRRKHAVAPMLSKADELKAGSLHWLYGMVLKSMSAPLFMSPRQLAQVSGIGEKRIRALMKAGKLRLWREPGSVQFKTTLPDLINAMEKIEGEPK